METQRLPFFSRSPVPRKDYEHNLHLALSFFRTSEAFASATSFLNFGFGLFSLYEGHFGRALCYLTSAYLSHETKIIARNCRKSLEYPTLGIQAAYARAYSDEAFCKFKTVGAPLFREIGLRYISFSKERNPPPPPRSFFSRILDKARMRRVS